MKHIKKFNEIFSTLGSLVGKGAGIVSKNAPKISISNKEEKKDDDLGKEILIHLTTMSTDYNRSDDYDEKTINKHSENWYYFIDSFFKNNNDKYKIDIIKHLDFKTKNTPEYTITLSKVGMTSGQYQGRLSGRGIKVRDTEGGKTQMRTYGNSNVQSSGDRLKLDPKIAKKIFSLAENIYLKVTKNVKDDARGK